MESYCARCCDEDGKPLQFDLNQTFFIIAKPKFGDCFVICGRFFTIEEIAGDYSKVFMREKKHVENKENKEPMPVFA